MSVRFDAATDQLTVASPPSPAAGITMVARVYSEVDQDDFATIGRIHATGTTILTWASSADGTGGPNYFTAGGTITNSEGVPVGQWRDVAVTCLGTAAESYARNPGFATEKDTGTVSSSGTPTQLAIGGRGGGDVGEWWNGRIACFRVWTAVLSQAEIEAEWDSPNAVRTSGLWADWPLATAADLTDHSGNGRDLAAGSTAVTTAGDPPFVLEVLAELAGVTPVPSGQLVATLIDPAQLAGTTPVPSGQLVATLVDPAQLAGVTPLPRGTLTGTVIDPSALTLPLRAGAATLVPAQRAGAATLVPGERAGTATLVPGWRAGAAA